MVDSTGWDVGRGVHSPVARGFDYAPFAGKKNFSFSNGERADVDIALI